MAKLKTKRVKVWCREKLTIYGCIGFLRPISNKIKPDNIKGPKVKFSRCPDCNRKLQLINKECQDAGCWHIYYPPHKKWIKP